MGQIQALRLCVCYNLRITLEICWFLEINVCTDNGPFSWKGEGDQVQVNLDC